MEAKEKAKELVDNYMIIFNFPDPLRMQPENKIKVAVQCSTIAVDEIINHCSQVEPFLGVDYWNAVKKELNKL